jgi:hypothetical protein
MTPAVRCAAHKLKGMVDVRNAKCEEPGCIVNPSFNYEGMKPAVRCAAHKLKGMVDVRSAKCEEPGCMVRPGFNYEGMTPAVRCATHALVSMINLRTGKQIKPPGYGANHSGGERTSSSDDTSTGLCAVRHCNCTSTLFGAAIFSNKRPKSSVSHDLCSI